MSLKDDEQATRCPCLQAMLDVENGDRLIPVRGLIRSQRSNSITTMATSFRDCPGIRAGDSGLRQRGNNRVRIARYRYVMRAAMFSARFHSSVATASEVPGLLWRLSAVNGRSRPKRKLVPLTLDMKRLTLRPAFTATVPSAAPGRPPAFRRSAVSNASAAHFPRCRDTHTIRTAACQMMQPAAAARRQQTSGRLRAGAAKTKVCSAALSSVLSNALAAASATKRRIRNYFTTFAPLLQTGSARTISDSARIYAEAAFAFIRRQRVIVRMRARPCISS